MYESLGGIEGRKGIRELGNLYTSSGYPKCIWVNPDPDPRPWVSTQGTSLGLGIHPDPPWVLGLGIHAEHCL
jgi:hypothetical protein